MCFRPTVTMACSLTRAEILPWWWCRTMYFLAACNGGLTYNTLARLIWVPIFLTEIEEAGPLFMSASRRPLGETRSTEMDSIITIMAAGLLSRTSIWQLSLEIRSAVIQRGMVAGQPILARLSPTL